MVLVVSVVDAVSSSAFWCNLYLRLQAKITHVYFIDIITRLQHQYFYTLAFIQNDKKFAGECSENLSKKVFLIM